MPTHRIRRGAAVLPGEAGKADSSPIYVNSSSNTLKYVPASTGTTEIEVADVSSVQTLVGKKNALVSGQGATATLTAAQSGSIVLFDRAAGIIYTLPAPAVGLNYTFVVTVSITSNNAKVITDAGTTLLIGSVFNAIGAGTGTQFIGNGTTHIAVLQNGTTTGGLIGTVFSVYCVNGTQWVVDGVVLGSGSVATPFSTT